MHARDEANLAAKRFCQRLDDLLNREAFRDDVTIAEFARQAGVDPSTIDRIRRGMVTPKLEIALSIVKAAAKLDRAYAAHLGHDFLDVFKPDSNVSADYNGDGKEDRDDILPAVAAVAADVSDLLLRCIEGLADGHVDNRDSLEIQGVCQSIRDHANGIEHLIRTENDRWSRARVRTRPSLIEPSYRKPLVGL